MKGGGEQINGREGETATLFVSLSFYPDVAWRRFRPTSTRPLYIRLNRKNRAAFFPKVKMAAAF